MALFATERKPTHGHVTTRQPIDSARQWTAIAAAGRDDETMSVRSRLADVPFSYAQRKNVLDRARDLVAGCRRRRRTFDPRSFPPGIRSVERRRHRANVHQRGVAADPGRRHGRGAHRGENRDRQLGAPRRAIGFAVPECLHLGIDADRQRHRAGCHGHQRRLWLDQSPRRSGGRIGGTGGDVPRGAYLGCRVRARQDDRGSLGERPFHWLPGVLRHARRGRPHLRRCGPPRSRLSACDPRARQRYPNATPVAASGVSIKLSALHPRFEPLQERRALAELGAPSAT